MAALLLGSLAAASLCRAYQRRREAQFARRLSVATAAYFV